MVDYRHQKALGTIHFRARASSAILNQGSGKRENANQLKYAMVQREIGTRCTAKNKSIINPSILKVTLANLQAYYDN